LNKQLTTVADIYQYFDQLVMDDADADTLFASSYLRGFIALSASEYGDEDQLLSTLLADSITEQLIQNRTELSPQDRALVKSYWQTLRVHFLE
jgi:hypothetical protein